jgi:hypothetical protein
MLAAFVGDLRAARALLERGASLSLTNCYGRTPLMLAAMAGHEEMVALLLSLGAAVDGVDAWGRDAATWAEERGFFHIQRHINTAARERRQWMVAQMRGGAEARSAAPAAPAFAPAFTPQAPAFDAVAERRHSADLSTCKIGAHKAPPKAQGGGMQRGSGGWSLGFFSSRRRPSVPGTPGTANTTSTIDSSHQITPPSHTPPHVPTKTRPPPAHATAAKPRSAARSTAGGLAARARGWVGGTR